MSDVFDQAQVLEQHDRDTALAAVRARLPDPTAAPAEDCRLCGGEIEPERRAALPGVQTCLLCQEARERQEYRA